MDVSAFARDGYVILPGLVPRDEIDRARRRIDDDLAADRTIGALPEYLGSSFCPGLRHDPVLLAPAARLLPFVGDLLEGGAARPLERAQIALRFPEHPACASPRRFHLDGFPATGNTVPRTSIRRHTLLGGVFLSRVDRDDAGALMVWPGSHARLAAAIAALDPTRYLDAQDSATLMERIEAVDLGAPVQLHVGAGDAVLVHHLVAHGGAPNLSVQVRYALYYRFQHPEHDPADPRSLLDHRAWFR